MNGLTKQRNRNVRYLNDFSQVLHFIFIQEPASGKQFPVALQIKWLVSIWNVTLGWNGLNNSSPDSKKKVFFNVSIDKGFNIQPYGKIYKKT